MVKYSYTSDGKFIINDYQNAKTFASFLPAIAGVDGKPMWAFFANVAQCMGGFGVNNRNTPITPFDSATLAYQNIPTKSFRTFVKVDDNYTNPFGSFDETQTMIISKTSFSISQELEDYKIEVKYFTLSRQKFSSLVRVVTFKNTTNNKKTYQIVDGLPIFLPYGLDNVVYKELVSLMAAYCEIHNLEENAPFVKFKTSTGDNSVVSEMEEGNGFVSFVKQGNKTHRAKPIVDIDIVFGKDKSLANPLRFMDLDYKDFIKQSQQTENKIPSAFITDEFSLNPGEEISFTTFFGSFKNLEEFSSHLLVNGNWEELVKNDESEEIISDLLKGAEVHTSNELFDLYIKQTFLDNGLRGGFPILLGKDEPYYVYSRKHGDMERDYNFFDIPSKYYSSGSGNFRDVNQNRRNDLYYAPYVKDYNIKIFFNLIQADGQNPLTVKPNHFHKKDNFDESLLKDLSKDLREKVLSLLNDYEPSDLFTLLKDNDVKDYQKLFEAIIGQSYQSNEACFGEGYWVDHWTYNVDLLENFMAIYPDKEEELLFGNEYKYFYSPVYVEPRREKVCLTPSGVRQYGAINLKRVKEECEKRGLDIKKTYWLKDKNGNEVKTTLASKIFNLSLIKFTCLDPLQMGIDMECEKPGWNDAMNGLPGLFASGMSESIELLRLVRFAINSLKNYQDREIEVLKEQYELYCKVKKNLSNFLNKKLSSFEYWDLESSSREEFRLKIKNNVSGLTKKISIRNIVLLFKKIAKVLEEGIKKAREVGKGIVPSYLIYNVSKYERTGYINHTGYETVIIKEFDLQTIPPFLEASARMFKLGKSVAKLDDYKNIKASDLYDKKLHIYKTCASIDDAPFEIGRVHAFTKGWLERECNFLHMSYKYLLGLLKGGYYKQFYLEAKDNLVVNMDTNVYGRSILENSSFIVPTCNPDSSKHGQGFFARLTGANAEMINMVNIMFIGEHPFRLKEGKLTFVLEPKLSKEMFDKDGKASCRLFTNVEIIYFNPNRINAYEAKDLIYKINNKEYKEIPEDIAIAIREGKINKIEVEIK